MSLENWDLADNANDTLWQLPDKKYIEMKGTGNESYSPGASTANKKYGVNWIYRASFLDDLLGYSYIKPNGGISRVLPEEHPDIDNFFAEDATVEGNGVLDKDVRDVAKWDIAFINVNYKNRDYDLLTDDQIQSEMDRYTSRYTKAQGDYLTINGAMKFVTSGNVLQSPPGKIIGTLTLEYIWREVPTDPDKPFIVPNLDAIKNCLGKVNSTYFDPLVANYPPGTVLFVGAEPKMVTPKLSNTIASTPRGNFVWDITMQFLVRDNGVAPGTGDIAGHNYIYDVKFNRWDLITADGTLGGPRIYQEADLNSLWEIGS